jgi:uncharacterized membrane protein YphA (DoxX/SURF4 family)
MTSEKTPMAFGRLAFGFGVMALGVAGLALGDFLAGQPAPKSLPERTAFADAVAVFMLVAGAAVLWRRTAAWAAAALTVYFGLFAVVLMDGRVWLAHPGVYGAYENIAEQLAITAGALSVYAQTARLDPALASRLTLAGRLAFGVCAIVFGGAHFAYMNLTAPLVPKWLPPSQVFWGYATGVAHIAGGLALVTGVRARLAAILLAIMYGSWTPLVHLPILFANPHNHGSWNENATNLALTGVAWVIADSLRRSGSAAGRPA